MKKVEAVIKPFKLDDVREALSEIALAVRKATPSSTVAPSMWWIFCPR